MESESNSLSLISDEQNRVLESWTNQQPPKNKSGLAASRSFVSGTQCRSQTERCFIRVKLGTQDKKAELPMVGVSPRKWDIIKLHSLGALWKKLGWGMGR